MARVEYILPLQGVLDDLRRDSLPAAAAITQGTKEALVDAQTQLGTFKKLQKAVRRIQLKAVSGAYYKWKDFVDDGNAEQEAKFQQPHVKEFFKRIMESRGKYYFQLFQSAGRLRRKRLEEERLFREQAEKDREGIEAAKKELAKLKEARSLAVLRRILNQELSRAWSQWVSVVSAARETKRLTGGVLDVMEEQLREAVEKLSALQDENEDLKKANTQLKEAAEGEDPRLAALTRERDELAKQTELLEYKLKKAEDAYNNKPQFQTLGQSKQEGPSAEEIEAE